MTRPAPLAGLKVLDLSRLLPGPYATLVLADLGAEVVKVEEPRGGDYLRWMPPLVGDTSALFLALNRGKRSVALDLKSDGDRLRFLELARRADVVVESFRPGVMDKLGVGWQVLHRLNPKLVLCSISGYGQTGPYAQRAGHDVDYLALGGVLGLLGPKDGPPAMPHVQIADVAGGALTGLVGTLAALVSRGITGEGRWVDASMTEGAMAVLSMTIAAHLLGEAPAPGRGEGTLSGEAPCYGVYRTQDGRHLAVGALEPKFWAGVCRVLGRPELESAGLDQGEEGARARGEVQAIFASQPLRVWLEHFAQADVCVEPVLAADELAQHPLHATRGTFFEGPHGPAQRTAVRFADGETPPAQSPAPGLGADTERVFAEWLG